MADYNIHVFEKQAIPIWL